MISVGWCISCISQKNASNIIGFISYIIIIFLQASDAAYYQDWKSVKNEVSALKKRPAFQLPIFAQMACLVVIAICTTTVISSNLHWLLEHVCTNHACMGIEYGTFFWKISNCLPFLRSTNVLLCKSWSDVPKNREQQRCFHLGWNAMLCNKTKRGE